MTDKELLDAYFNLRPDAEVEFCRFWTEVNEIAAESGVSASAVLMPQWERIRRENPDFAGAFTIWLGQP